jgi:hypothetical protein
MSRSTFIFNPRSAMLLQEAAASTRSSGSSFSWQLYQMLADAESYDFQSIISWQPHGRAFRVHDPEKFEQMILPSYFKSSKYKSFSRQLNLYSFVRLSRAGPDQGACKFLFRGLLLLSTRQARRVVVRPFDQFKKNAVDSLHNTFVKL